MDAALEAAYAAVLRRIASPAWADDFYAAPPPVGPQLDALADPATDEHWSPLRWELFHALGKIQPWQKLAVLTMACNEAPYLAEWIAHHLAIGVARIFVYTNDNDDGTDEMLRWFSANAPVTMIPVHSAPRINVQKKNYRHAVALLPELRLYEWVAVIDIDEFLLPDARYGHHMPTMLAAAPADTEALLLPWHWRHWPRDFMRGPGLLAERFAHASPGSTIKCVTRLPHLTSIARVHFPEFDGPRTLRDSEFLPVDQAGDWINKRHWPGTGAWIEHFWGKSFEEFLVKKRRGDAMDLDGPQFHRDYDSFFKWTQPLTAQNLAPWPAAMLEKTKAKLASLTTKPGFTQLQQQIEARYATYAARVRTDPALRQRHAEMLARFPK
jgi:hypothetical protein